MRTLGEGDSRARAGVAFDSGDQQFTQDRCLVTVSEKQTDQRKAFLLCLPSSPLTRSCCKPGVKSGHPVWPCLHCGTMLNPLQMYRSLQELCWAHVAIPVLKMKKPGLHGS